MEWLLFTTVDPGLVKRGSKKIVTMCNLFERKDLNFRMQVGFPASGKQLLRELFPQDQHTEAGATVTQGSILR